MWKAIVYFQKQGQMGDDYSGKEKHRWRDRSGGKKRKKK
jgi:hypothetical protein